MPTEFKSAELKVSIGQHTDKGRKEVNQDFHGSSIPPEPLLGAKGVAIALADGIGSSAVSQVASETAVTSFLEDYFCTSEAWSVKKSAQQVLAATNSWLYAQNQRGPYRYEKDKGYVCTLSAIVIKSTTAHLFHVGDTRIYRLRGNALEQLTNDHRVWVSQEQNYLSRAVGMSGRIEIDHRNLSIDKGDVFLLATDGVYEHAGMDFMIDAINVQSDLEAAARSIVAEALRRGSDDNLTVQIVRIDELPAQTDGELQRQAAMLPLPPVLQARMSFDGYKIVREMHSSHRSHVFLAVDDETNLPVVIKTPSIDLQGDPAYLERFLLEEWIARRINSSHVLKPCQQTRKRNFLYVAMEFIEGRTLTQWMIDNPAPDVETVRAIVEQIAKGLQAFHRMEMLHQDLRPDNIMIDATGTVKIIDFGSTRVAGLMEIESSRDPQQILGTVQYTAPEYFLGDRGTARSDLFSLGVIAYQMLTGRLPYGAKVARSKTVEAQRNLRYESLLDDRREIPAWIDDVLEKAVHPNPEKRYEELSEFVYDLRHPNKAFLSKNRAPLLERNPVAFWRSLALLLAAVVVFLLIRRR